MDASINLSSYLLGAATIIALVLLAVGAVLLLAKWGGGGD